MYIHTQSNTHIQKKTYKINTKLFTVEPVEKGAFLLYCLNFKISTYYFVI